jgi:hypothetical protein
MGGTEATLPSIGKSITGIKFLTCKMKILKRWFHIRILNNRAPTKIKSVDGFSYYSLHYNYYNYTMQVKKM